MKNIYKILIAIVVLVGSVELTKAQTSSHSNPWPGSTHTYSFGDNGATNTTDWYISRNADGSTPIDGPAGNHFTLIDEDGVGTVDGDGVLTGIGVNTLRVNWDGQATGTYYVFLKVTDAVTSCSNLKGFKVDVVTGRFNAIAENVTGGTNLANPELVNDANIVADGCSDETSNRIVNDGTFSLGSSEVVYRVKREYSLNEWHLDYGLSVGTTTTVVAEDGSTIAAAGGGGYDIPASVNYVLVYVSVPNVEATSQAVVFTIDGALTKDITTNTADNASTPANTPADNTDTYTIKSMPTISSTMTGGN